MVLKIWSELFAFRGAPNWLRACIQLVCVNYKFAACELSQRYHSIVRCLPWNNYVSGHVCKQWCSNPRYYSRCIYTWNFLTRDYSSTTLSTK